MRKIFIGMLFIFINFNLDLGTTRIGLVPNFVGYIIMIGGIKELLTHSDHFKQVLPLVRVGAVYATVCYALDLVGFWNGTVTPVDVIWGLLSTALSLFISYKILMGIQDIERKLARDLQFQPLYQTWKLYAVASILTGFLFFVPVLMIVGVLVCLCIGIFYLYRFNQTKNLYYNEVH